MFLDFLSSAEKMSWCLSKIGLLVFSQKCFEYWNLSLVYFDFLSSIAVLNWWHYREN